MVDLPLLALVQIERMPSQFDKLRLLVTTNPAAWRPFLSKPSLKFRALFHKKESAPCCRQVGRPHRGAKPKDYTNSGQHGLHSKQLPCYTHLSQASIVQAMSFPRSFYNYPSTSSSAEEHYYSFPSSFESFETDPAYSQLLTSHTHPSDLDDYQSSSRFQHAYQNSSNFGAPATPRGFTAFGNEGSFDFQSHGPFVVPDPLQAIAPRPATQGQCSLLIFSKHLLMVEQDPPGA